MKYHVTNNIMMLTPFKEYLYAHEYREIVFMMLFNPVN